MADRAGGPIHQRFRPAKGAPGNAILDEHNVELQLGRVGRDQVEVACDRTARAVAKELQVLAADRVGEFPRGQTGDP